MSNLKAAKGSVIVMVDMEFKNNHTFSGGVTIRLERDRENFDRTHTAPMQGIVMNADGIPEGSEILFHHNAVHDTNKIFNYKQVGGDDIASNICYFSMPERQCYLWREPGGVWNPVSGFVTALRVFVPYKGILEGIDPKKMINTLYITYGEFKGKVVRTLKACDAMIVFRNEKGVEERIIRCRHFEDEENEREEVIATDEGATKKVLNGELYIGLSVSDAKPLNSSTHANAKAIR